MHNYDAMSSGASTSLLDVWSASRLDAILSAAAASGKCEFCSSLADISAEANEKGISVESLLYSYNDEYKEKQKKLGARLVAQKYAASRLEEELRRLNDSIHELEAEKAKNGQFFQSIKMILDAIGASVTESQVVQLEEASQIHDRVQSIKSFTWLLAHYNDADDSELLVGIDAFRKFLREEKVSVVWDTSLKEMVQMIKDLIDTMADARPDVNASLLRVVQEICSFGTTADLFVEEGGWDVVKRLLTSVNDDTKSEAATLVSLISRCDNLRYVLDVYLLVSMLKEQCSTLCEEEDVCRPVVKMLSSSNEFVLEHGIVALWSICSSGSGRKIMADADTLEAIRSLLDVDNDFVLENSVVALGYLTREDNVKSLMRETGTLDAILSIVDLEVSDDIKSKVAGVLWNCASNEENRDFLRENGGIERLVKLMLSSTTFGVLENTTGALWNLAVSSDNRERILTSGGLEALIALILERGDVTGVIIENATGALWNCTANTECRAAMRKLNGLEALSSVLRAEYEKTSWNMGILEHTAGAIRNCALNDQNKIYYRTSGIIETLVDLLAPSPPEAADKIAATLWICTLDEDTCKLLGKMETIEKVCSLLGKVPWWMTSKLLGILKNIASVGSNGELYVGLKISKFIRHAINISLEGDDKSAAFVKKDKMLETSVDLLRIIVHAAYEAKKLSTVFHDSHLLASVVSVIDLPGVAKLSEEIIDVIKSDDDSMREVMSMQDPGFLLDLLQSRSKDHIRLGLTLSFSLLASPDPKDVPIFKDLFETIIDILVPSNVGDLDVAKEAGNLMMNRLVDCLLLSSESDRKTLTHATLVAVERLSEEMENNGESYISEYTQILRTVAAGLQRLSKDEIAKNVIFDHRKKKQSQSVL